MILTNVLRALDPYLGAGLALALGLLIGVERGWSHRLDPDGSRIAGIRTFGVLGLVGGLAGTLGAHGSMLMGAIVVLLAGAALLIGYAGSAAKGDLSATTAIVGVETLGLGVLAATGHMVLASVAAAVTTLTLSQRRQLHQWVAGLSEAEVQAIARFGLIALAILPLLPDRAFGPLDAWNLRQIWMVVVLVSGLSLVGYAVSTRLGGSKAILVTAAAGAVVSSTAVTASLASHLRRGDADEAGLVAGIALATSVMFARVLILVAVLTPFALPALALVAVPAGLTSAVAVAWILRAPRNLEAPGPAHPVRNPFDLGPALLLGALVMVISLAGKWSLGAFGGAGLATVLGISGALDVDAAVIALSGLAPGSITSGQAGLALAAPILANTLVKAVLALFLAGGRAGWRAAAPLLFSLAAGGAGVLLLLLRGPA